MRRRAADLVENAGDTRETTVARSEPSGSAAPSNRRASCGNSFEENRFRNPSSASRPACAPWNRATISRASATLASIGWRVPSASPFLSAANSCTLISESSS